MLDNVCGNKMNSKWSCWTPVANINLRNNKRASTSSGDTFNQGETSFFLYITGAQGNTHFFKCLINILDVNKFMCYQFIRFLKINVLFFH